MAAFVAAPFVALSTSSSSSSASAACKQERRSFFGTSIKSSSSKAPTNERAFFVANDASEKVASATVSRRGLLTAAFAAAAFSVAPKNAFAGKFDKEMKYIEPIKRQLDSINEIEKAIKAGKWATVESEAKELGKIGKPLNLLAEDLGDREKEKKLEELAIAFEANVKKLEETEDKKQALVDFQDAKSTLTEFLKVAGIEFEEEDLYEQLQEGKKVILKE